jgi:hypothetical protein
VCPAVGDRNLITNGHQTASRDDIRKRFLNHRIHQNECASPTYQVFEKTAAFITALRRIGCRAPKYEDTVMNAVEKEAYKALMAHHVELKRGYSPENFGERCEGRIILEFDHHDKPFVR